MDSDDVDFQQHVALLPYAYAGPLTTGLLKKTPEDFIVNEILSFLPNGEGEHAYLYIQKTNLNTEDVVKILARHANVTRRSVSFAGMKDRHAITQQWFSVHLPGLPDPDWTELNNENLIIKEVVRHQRKLKRGAIKENQFTITIRDVNVDENAVSMRLQEITNTGIPNYFMQQRFGYKSNNLSLAYRLFSQNKKIKDRNKKGILLSAVRSYLFNEVLSQRITDKTWNVAIQGDAFVLNGTRNYFETTDASAEITRRLEEQDIHVSGPLYGKGKEAVFDKTLLLESEIMRNNPVFCSGLLKEKMELSRRSLRAVVKELKVDFPEVSQICMSFKLPSGSYATAVIRELFEVN